MNNVIPWESLLQLGGMSAVTAVLLFVFINDRIEHNKTLKAMSVTMVTFQQLFLIHAFVRSKEEVVDCEECRKYLDALVNVQRIVETQRNELERMLSAK